MGRLFENRFAKMVAAGSPRGAVAGWHRWHIGDGFSPGVMPLGLDKNKQQNEVFEPLYFYFPAMGQMDQDTQKGRLPVAVKIERHAFDTAIVDKARPHKIPYNQPFVLRSHRMGLQENVDRHRDCDRQNEQPYGRETV